MLSDRDRARRRGDHGRRRVLQVVIIMRLALLDTGRADLYNATALRGRPSTSCAGPAATLRFQGWFLKKPIGIGCRALLLSGLATGTVVAVDDWAALRSK